MPVGARRFKTNHYGAQEEWEALGLEKRIDFDNLKRVFERLDLKRDGRIDPAELADTYKVSIPDLAFGPLLPFIPVSYHAPAAPSASNIWLLLQELNHKPRRQTEYGLSEIEDIIWEVDEDANGWIDWENFVQLYLRCRNDRSVSLLLLACYLHSASVMRQRVCVNNNHRKDTHSRPIFVNRDASRQDCSIWLNS